jgi:hypothetical protein
MSYAKQPLENIGKLITLTMITNSSNNVLLFSLAIYFALQKHVVYRKNWEFKVGLKTSKLCRD